MQRSSNWSLWLVCGLFLAVLAFLAVVVQTARGDDFDAKIAQLKAKMAAKRAKAADPFAGKNAAGYTRTYLDGGLGAQSVCDCGCIETGKCVCPNCCSPVKTRSIRQASASPQIGDTMVTDDPARPWTYGYGREFGYDELGWYRPVATLPVYQPVPYYQPARSFAPNTIFRNSVFSGGGCSSGSCR